MRLLERTAPRLVPVDAGSRVAVRRRRAELAFLPAALEIVEAPPSPTARVTAAAFTVILTAAIVWASVGHVDIITTAPGRVVATGRTKVIQPFETGVLRSIDVTDGMRVKAGQPLLTLDPTSHQAERDRASHDLMLAMLDQARLQALLRGDIGSFVPPSDADEASLATARPLMTAQWTGEEAKLSDLDHQASEKRAELAEVNAEINRIDATMPMLQAHLKIREQGVRTGSGNQIDYYDAMRAVVDQQQQRMVEQTKVQQTAQSLASIMQQREQAGSDFRSGLLNDRSKAEATAAEKRQDLIEATQLTNLETLRAPVDGVVQQLAVRTVGGVVTPAQPLLQVVPDDAPLEIEAMIPNREVGFVHSGQNAEVKIETLEFTHYGLLHGTVGNVSQDAVASDPLRQGPSQTSRADRAAGQAGPDAQAGMPPDGDPDYVAHINLRERGLQTEQGFVSLEPGMTVTAEIRTGRRRVIDYLLSPLRQYHHDAFTER